MSEKPPIDEDDRKYLQRPERPLEQAGFMFIPKTWEQLYAYAKEIAGTEFVPDQMRGKPGAVLAAWQKGQEVGLPPMAALQSIAIIRGRPAIHSSGYWGLITSNPLCEDWSEVPPHETVRMGYGECTIKRRGKKEPITRRYTIEMAKEAGLWGGTGDTKEKKEQSVWFKNPGRMLQQRARHLAGEDAIPEASQGLLPADIAMDLEPVGTLDVTPPLQMPQAVKQPADGAAADQGNESETIAKRTREIQDRVENSASQEGAQGVEASEAPTGNGPAHEKPGLQEVLDWIAGADATVFKDTAALSMKLKGFDNKDQMIICRAWNDRSRKAKQ